MASTVLTRTPSSAGNRKTFTWSFWFKRTATGAESALFCHGANAGSDMCMLRFDPDNLNLHNANSSSLAFSTNGKLLDSNAWYHVVLRIDTTQATNTDRMRLYINGVQETSFSSITYPNQNDDTNCNTTSTLYIGERPDDNKHFDGIMSHVHFCDGYSYGADSFGETDATTGEWKINTSPSVSYGTNGFFILKDGNSVTDQSPNSNNFTVAGGTLTKTEDNPSNVFCILNTADKRFDNTTLTNGNLTCTGGRQSTGFDMIRGSIGVTSGKYYFEVKAVDNAEIDQIGIGILNGKSPENEGASGLNGNLQGYGVQMSNGYKVGVSQSGAAYMGGFSANEILQVAIDLDNDKITFGRNGQWANGSGGADQTYANSTAAFTGLTDTRGYTPMFAGRDSGNNNQGTMQFNFGNGYFGTSAVSSAGTNASGNGIFEYDVPTGFTALSTKGLNE